MCHLVLTLVQWLQLVNLILLPCTLFHVGAIQTLFHHATTTKQHHNHAAKLHSFVMQMCFLQSMSSIWAKTLFVGSACDHDVHKTGWSNAVETEKTCLQQKHICSEFLEFIFEHSTQRLLFRGMQPCVPPRALAGKETNGLWRPGIKEITRVVATAYSHLQRAWKYWC